MSDHNFSRRIIKILRHDTEGLSMTSDGFMNVSDLLEHVRSDLSEEDVKDMVKTDSKKRYALRQYKKKLQIKATRGHTETVFTQGGMSHHNFSRRVIKILRHDTEGLSMTSDGFMNVSDLLEHVRSDLSEEDVKDMVKTDSKKRYALRQYKKKLQIKATQGHTITVDVSMKDTRHKIGLHGTFMSNWEQIKSQGLSRQKRNHIHFASQDPGCISGIPSNRDVIIEVDIEKAKRDGLEFFESENGVILSPGNSSGVIGKKYFKRAYHKAGRMELSLK